MRLSPVQSEFVHQVLAIMAKHEAHEDLEWRVDNDTVQFYIRCNDIFFWGTSDTEEITPENVDVLDQSYADSEDFGGLLFCARARKLRPQGAAYQVLGFSEEDAALFDAAGPEREIDIANPAARDGEWSYPEPTGTYYPNNMR